MYITVYLGASYGNDLDFRKEIKMLGNWISENGHILVYGGENIGLMGDLAESVADTNGEIIGVQTVDLMKENHTLNNLSKLIVTKDVAERKEMMMNLGDVFIAFPGGISTLDEIMTVMGKNSRKEIRKPCIFYNIKGYYDNIQKMLETMVSFGLSTHLKQNDIYFIDDADKIDTVLGYYY